MLSVQLRLGLPFLLLPCCVHNSTCFGSLSLSIRTTCPYHLSWLVLMSSTIVVLTFMMSLILSFLIRSLLDLPADLLQKSISVVRSMFSDFFFSGHISLLYVTMLFMMVLYILFLLSFEMPWSHNTLFNTEIAFLPCVHLSLMVLSIVPSLVMLIPRYLYSSHRLMIH
jgi:hypothetical protein